MIGPRNLLSCHRPAEIREHEEDREGRNWERHVCWVGSKCETSPGSPMTDRSGDVLVSGDKIIQNGSGIHLGPPDHSASTEPDHLARPSVKGYRQPVVTLQIT